MRGVEQTACACTEQLENGDGFSVYCLLKSEILRDKPVRKGIGEDGLLWFWKIPVSHVGASRPEGTVACLNLGKLLAVCANAMNGDEVMLHTSIIRYRVKGATANAVDMADLTEPAPLRLKNWTSEVQAPPHAATQA